MSGCVGVTGQQPPHGCNVVYTAFLVGETPLDLDVPSTPIPATPPAPTIPARYVITPTLAVDILRPL